MFVALVRANGDSAPDALLRVSLDDIIVVDRAFISDIMCNDAGACKAAPCDVAQGYAGIMASIPVLRMYSCIAAAEVDLYAAAADRLSLTGDVLRPSP